MAVPLEQFVKQLEESGILAGDTLQDFLPPRGEPKDAEELARELVRQKKLTKFQAAEVYRGQGKSLTLGNYTLLEKIGAGGMGQVFKAEHRRMHRIVAVKMLPAGMLKNPAVVARFEREVRAAAKLNHPNIVTAFDADNANGVLLLIMEYVEGTDLSALVKKNGPLPVEQAVNYVLQAARGLAAAHFEGIVHRDIKPANLLLDQNGVVKILDMGLARIDSVGDASPQSELTNTGAVMGTVDYMAPEQALDTKTADARADIYSLGCTLFYLLTGKPVYTGDTLMKKLLAHREQPIPSLQAIRPEVPAQIDAVFRRMVAKQVEDRYQTISEVIADLERLGTGQARPAEPQVSRSSPADEGMTNFLKEISAGPTPSTRPKKSAAPVTGRSRHQIVLVGGGLGVLIILAALALLPGKKGRTPLDKVDQPAGTGQGRDKRDGGGNARKEISGLTAALNRDRKAAEWVLSKTGFVQVKGFGSNGSVTTVHKPTDFPAGGWELRAIFLFDDRLTDKDLSQISHLDHLEVLDLSGPLVTDEGIEHLKDFPMLRELRISGTAMTAKVVEELAHLQMLSGISANADHFTERMVAALKKFPLLNSLAVVGATDVEIELVVREFPEVVYLALANAQATPRGYAALRNLRQLVYFTAPSSTITDTDLQALTEHADMQNLGLTKAQLTDAAIPALSRFSRLQQLAIDGTKITAAGVAQLREALPDCEIISDFPAYRFPDRSASASRAAAKKPQAFETPAFETWMKDVAGLSVEKQVEAVARKLRELNPGFDGKLTPTIDFLDVTGLQFVTDNVTDISPVRALTKLKALTCIGSNSGKDKGGLSDLSPLNGIPLTTLVFYHNQVPDLSPLKGMPLKILRCDGNPVSDLLPLKGMRLESLFCGYTNVSDLSPLRGMPLTNLVCEFSPVSDLAPLTGMPLANLNCIATPVSDLSPLKGMPLTSLRCSATKVVDLSPLRGLPLIEIVCDFNRFRDAELLRSIKTLTTINKPAPEFWKEVDAQQAAFESWAKPIASLSAEKQVEAVARKLKELNPGFDGKVTPRIDFLDVAEVQFETDNVTDISPVRALTKLKGLKCGGRQGVNGQLSDLSPLTGMRLTSLNIAGTRVSDLSPLSGMPLTILECQGTQVADLSPLKGMPLSVLYCYTSPVSDLMPLKGMPLTVLAFGGTPVSDLSPLTGMPLTSLSCNSTQITDFSPLKNMPLTHLTCDHTPVSDLSPLRGLPLVDLVCDFKPERDTEVLRSITTLEKINGKPAADFWKEFQK